MARSGGRIDFTVGLKADKSGFNQIIKSIQAIQNKLNNSQGRLQPQFLKAADAARQLQGILNSSWNAKLGQLNLDSVSAGIKNIYGDVNKLRDTLNAGGVEGQKVFNDFASSVLNTNLQIKESNKILNDFADTFGKTVKYGIASSIFNNMKNSLQQAFYFAKDLDLSLTDIRIVTGDSADEMERFAKTANEAAKDLGRSTLDYTKAALTFYQQGRLKNL